MVDEAESPFLFAYLLDGHGHGQPIDAAGVEAWTPDQGVLWVHLDVLNPAARQWLSARSDIDNLARENLLAGETRPRVVPESDSLLLVLRGVNTNPGADPDDMVSIRVWIDANRIISSRRRKLLSVFDIRDSLDAGKGPTTPSAFVVNLVERLADRIGHVVDAIEEAIEEFEAQAAENTTHSFRSALAARRRETAAIRRYLAPQRDALDRLYRHPGSYFSEKEANELREQSDRITRYLEDLELARERAIVLQEEFQNRMAQEQNARVYLLSVVAAVFLPLTFVTGLLGMNVAGLPGTETPYAFFISLTVMGLLGIALVVFFRWKRWI
ncbi:MAG: zinc transporter ZntB [Gammaproteobacteria bacterium]|nr:zinc transporter ZntB [Gammaproteobacteria bacterium]MDH3505900.1 zinc transporter ZntB [Gammaproteobacteria bacterium]